MDQGRKGKGLANQQQQQQPRRCPRCESTNTKFCYYNNYSQSQPRHFCKACRRYWTEGGTLRNVPQGGGGGRKGKRTKRSSASSASLAASPSSGTDSMSLQSVPEVTLPPPSPYFFSGGGIGEGLMGLQSGNFTGFHSGGGIMTDFGEQSVMMPLMLPQGFLNFPQQQNLLPPMEPNLMINPRLVPAPHQQFINNTATAVFATTATTTTVAPGVGNGEGFWSTVFGNGGLPSGLPPPPTSSPF